MYLFDSFVLHFHPRTQSISANKIVRTANKKWALMPYGQIISCFFFIEIRF